MLVRERTCVGVRTVTECIGDCRSTRISVLVKGSWVSVFVRVVECVSESEMVAWN